MTLAASPDLESQALRLTELVMRAGRPILGEQPLAFDPAFEGHRLVIQRDGRVVSSLATLKRHLVVGGERIPIGLIGSVVTDPDYRGAGFASQLLGRAEAQLRSEGALLAMLWADKIAFYEARGYVSIGTELDYRVTPQVRPSLPSCSGVRVALAGDLARIHELYCTQPERVDRSLEETQALASGPGIRALVRETDGQVDSYALEGRGEDLSGVIHEWAGAMPGVLACIAGHLDQLASADDGLWCLVPAKQFEMQSVLNAIGVPGALGVLGMAKLLNVDQAVDWFNRATPATVHASSAGADMHVQGLGAEYLLTPAQVLSTLVAPKANRETIAAVESALGVELPELPQQPFLWGLDSI